MSDKSRDAWPDAIADDDASLLWFVAKSSFLPKNCRKLLYQRTTGSSKRITMGSTNIHARTQMQLINSGRVQRTYIEQHRFFLSNRPDSQVLAVFITNTYVRRTEDEIASVSLEKAKDYDNKSFVLSNGNRLQIQDVWPCERLATEVEHLKQNRQVLRKGNQVQLETGAPAVDAQKSTLERVTQCAA